MNILKKVLFSLVAVLVLIVGGGGAYLSASGNMSHLSGGHKVASQNSTSDSGESTNNQQQQQDQNSQMTDNMNMTGDNGTTEVTTSGSTYSTNNGTSTQTIPQAPPIRVINPEPFYDKLNQAQEIIDEANKMITVDPYSATGKDKNMNAPDMAKLHQGIYRLSQGVTVMKETLDTLNGEIKGQTQFGVDPYQQYRYQVSPNYSMAVPYVPNGAPNYAYPQGHGYPN